ncbi:putative 2-oxoglutarate-dependent dioxygenase [Podospora australis]|uniref:2-oxoglutarate-dependent dioxygenase n=1 Tax=Podospora australis TaxID=1536484 RepID=A0AAN6WQI9_9PEZI|nr:putative 2-oxoglutarate-dependent dioxygenase [Podospora australis]
MTETREFTSIPILDLSFAADISTKRDFVDQLRHALINVGFLYIENHALPTSLISTIISILHVIFSLSREEKKQVGLINSPHFLGYSGGGTEMTAGKPDRREQFEFATELTATWNASNQLPLYERLRGPNQWPPVPEGSTINFRELITAYIEAITSLSSRFLHLVAEALSLPPGTLHEFLSDQHRLRLVRYPPAPQGSSQGVGPRKDSSGWFTFLLQASDVKGLQVLNASHEWIDVPPIPGTFVVNIGQAFEVVTHGLCKATIHRVVMADESKERFSVPFFQGVRRDLTKSQALGLRQYFQREEGQGDANKGYDGIDSPFLKGKYDTWGESQLRTKIRSHRDVGRKWYPDVFDKYVEDDG